MTRRRIQPRPSVELETVTLRLAVQLVRSVDQYAKYLGGSTDRTHVISQAIEIALAQDRDFQKVPGGDGAAPAAGAPRDRVAAVSTSLLSTLVPGGARSAPSAPPRNTRAFTAGPFTARGRAFSSHLF